MIERVISGGQTGADQAGLLAAHAAGILTGGYAPLGWLTEDGPAPWLADFGLVEFESPGYPARTEANVRAANGCLWFGDQTSRGGVLTFRLCHLLGKPISAVREGITPRQVRRFLDTNHQVKTLLIAGNRESINPGIGERTEAFLGRLFRK